VLCTERGASGCSSRLVEIPALPPNSAPLTSHNNSFDVILNLMQALRRTQFGNPILRQQARRLKPSEIIETDLQQLIAAMRHTLLQKKLGIGLAAPQVGHSVAVVVIAIRPLAHRQQVEPFDLVLINPEITQTFGRRIQLYEGCISGGPGKAALFAKVPRYQKIQVKFWDKQGRLRHEIYEGLQAHVIQHETDHLNGILFVDRVVDSTTYLTYAEYMKRARKILAKQS